MPTQPNESDPAPAPTEVRAVAHTDRPCTAANAAAIVDAMPAGVDTLVVIHLPKNAMITISDPKPTEGEV